MCWTPERRHGRSSFAETTVQHLAMEGHEAMKTHTSYHHTDREKHGGKNMGRNVTCLGWLKAKKEAVEHSFKNNKA